jgi:hypothetical protein
LIQRRCRRIERTWWNKGVGNIVLGSGELASGVLALGVAAAATDGGAAVLFGIAAALGLSTGFVQSTEGGYMLMTADKRSAEQDIALNNGMAQMALITGSWGGLMGGYATHRNTRFQKRQSSVATARGRGQDHGLGPERH